MNAFLAPALGTRRLLMTAEPVSGVWTYVLELTEALQRHGVEVVVASMGKLLSQEQRRQAVALSNLEIREGTYKLEWMESAWGDLAAAGQWLLDLERRFEPDLIHLNGYVHGTLPWRAPLVVVGHPCVLTWWRAVRERPAAAEWARYRKAVAAGLHAADLVVVPSRTMLNELQEYYGPLANLRVIANGRKPPAPSTQPKEKLVLAAGTPWVEAQPLASLGAIAPELPWPVYATGASDRERGGPNPAGAIHGAIQFLGALAEGELASWLARASIFVLPAGDEPCGFSALEAGLAGCALVLADLPAWRELWGEAAWFVPPGEPSALRAALKELMDHPGTLAELAGRARAAAAHYDPERMAVSYLLAYREVLLRPRPSQMRRVAPELV